jgi:5'-phosphate synthase pdxT subunit
MTKSFVEKSHEQKRVKVGATPCVARVPMKEVGAASAARALTIGILALQGDFAEHCAAVERCNAIALEIRHSWQLNDIDGLIIPGGESTAIAKLTKDNDDPIFDAILSRAKSGMPIYGTCMGSIFLAKEIEGSTQGRLGIMDIKVRRNAFGPQKNSFQTFLPVDEIGSQPFPAVFIRAPIVLSCGPGVHVLAQMQEGIVMAKQDNLLITTFHPEITDDLRVHRYFLSMAREYNKHTDAIDT